MSDTTAPQAEPSRRKSEHAKIRIWNKLSAFAGPLVMAGVALFLIQSCVRSQKTALFVKDRIVALANDSLIPQLDILHIHRNSATSYDLEGITLTHPDGTTIISIHRAEISLAAIPLPGKPLQFESIELFRPRVELIETDTGLLGLSPILKAPKTEPSESQSESSGSFSDIIELRNVSIRNGTVRYTTLDQPDTPMVLDNILLSTSLQPTPDDEPGWQRVSLDLGREPGVSIDLEGRLNLNTWRLQIARLDLDAAIDRSTADSLPPTLQKIIRDAQLHGDLIAGAIGEVPLMAPREADLRVTLELENGHAVVGNSQVPIDRAQGTFLIENGGVQSRNLLAEVAGGRVWGTFAVEPQIPGTPLTAVLRAKDIEIGYLSGSERITGTAAASGSISFDTATQNPEPKLGEMTITLADASILSMPVFRQLAAALDAVPKVSTSNKHRVEASLDIMRDRITINDLLFVTAAIAGDIQGDVLYDGTLDLEAKAGPLARAREMLGSLGPLGMPFEKLVEIGKPYKITGPVANPTVKILGKTISGQNSEQAPNQESP